VIRVGNMKTMTRRERLTRCYFNQEVDRPAVYSRTGFPEDDPSYDRLKAYLEAHSELKSRWSGRQFESRYPVERLIEPHSEDFERWIEILHTPAGHLQRSSFVSLKGQPGLQRTFLISCREDAQKYLALGFPDLGGDTSSFFAARADVGEKGIVDVDLGSNPGGFVVELCGSESFAVMSCTPSANGRWH